MKLQLVRHAQSTSNVLRTLNTRMPGPPLTELGRQQADALADQLVDARIVGVYASVAVRAQQTAAPLAARHGLDVRVVDGLQEIFVGDLEDRGDTEALTAFAEVFHPWTRGQLDLAMPGGESGHDVAERFRGAIAQIRSKHEQEHPDGTVVVVSHGAAMRLCAELLADNVPPNLADAGLIPNTGSIVLEAMDGGGWHCHSWAGVDM
ncbi:histidine phosphatase family protein [Haloechinothrix halophila]|uniref:histidine phosphatase family protein n=1 Tax=Haloechinothrix halophila TaxID=1069073 RepID=UPI00040F723E|nr:histidine phosphatase family protein [Haloechinothrix halophila]